MAIDANSHNWFGNISKMIIYPIALLFVSGLVITIIGFVRKKRKKEDEDK